MAPQFNFTGITWLLFDIWRHMMLDPADTAFKSRSTICDWNPRSKNLKHVQEPSPNMCVVVETGACKNYRVGLCVYNVCSLTGTIWLPITLKMCICVSTVLWKYIWKLLQCCSKSLSFSSLDTDSCVSVAFYTDVTSVSLTVCSSSGQKNTLKTATWAFCDWMNVQ